MKYDHSKGKGIKERGEICRKVFFEKEASYNSVLKIMQEELFKECVTHTNGMTNIYKYIFI